ncbi:DNA polymerase Y family protein [Paracoccus sp. S1E-3]|uniref:Y-family DNA polymerase n=1 Tax=Paracoccus sp. S1E-3 TaxID=2756130 RepID=UPI0015EFAC8B|nr:DNA polymerase Y family protein [Paracoccus sp. S1E-3]MBA4492658.1 DNA polymerase Y family protein [Paracoccus sp. S1E-3]
MRQLARAAQHQAAAPQAGSAPPANTPFALWVEGTHGPVIHAANPVARAAGITLGARLTDMRAILPDLRADPADPAGDAAALAQLALWARRFCPWTTVDASGPGAPGLVMDTTGSAHLWRGEAGMLTAIRDQLAGLGHAATVAFGPTWGAAWALSRYAAGIAYDGAALHPLPVAALRLSEATALILRRLGLKTVGDLAAMPRVALARRFARHDAADNPLIRLDQAMGRLPEPISPPDPPVRFRVESRLPEPVLDATHHLPDLAAALCRALSAAAQGARLLRLSVWRTDGEIRWIEAGAASPTRDPDHMVFLFRDRLERIDPGFGFDLIELAAPETEAFAPTQRDLGGAANESRDLPRLIDRLAARFGADRLRRPALLDSHIPERSHTETALHGIPPPIATEAQDRPARMLDPPEEVRVLYAVPEGPPAQFQWRGKPTRITRWQGPERIAPEWWLDHPGTRLRDYYKIEDERGQRLWLYREGLAGDGRGPAPRWFVQGVFA